MTLLCNIYNKIYRRQATIKPINSNFTLYVDATVDKSCPMQFGIFVKCYVYSELFN